MVSYIAGFLPRLKTYPVYTPLDLQISLPYTHSIKNSFISKQSVIEYAMSDNLKSYFS
jgi:hypothetical protein